MMLIKDLDQINPSDQQIAGGKSRALRVNSISRNGGRQKKYPSQKPGRI